MSYQYMHYLLPEKHKSHHIFVNIKSPHSSNLHRNILLFINKKIEFVLFFIDIKSIISLIDKDIIIKIITI